MNESLRFIISLLSISLAFTFIWLGTEWMQGNIGLNPWAAVPFAFVCALAPLLLYLREIDVLETELEYSEYTNDLDCARIADLEHTIQRQNETPWTDTDTYNYLQSDADHYTGPEPSEEQARRMQEDVLNNFQ